jgi:hypothetical protein
VIDQPGAAPVSVTDQPDSGPLSSIVTCSWWDCRNATAVVPQVIPMTAVTAAALPDLLAMRRAAFETRQIAAALRLTV